MGSIFVPCRLCSIFVGSPSMLGQSNGNQASYLMYWALPSTVLAGLVGAVLALKDGKFAIPATLPWSYSFRTDTTTNNNNNNSLEKPLLVPGLQNLENNCFLNVVLQALASCFCFQSFLHRVISESGTQDLDESMPLALSLASLLQELGSVCEEKVTLSPRKVMLTMAHYIPNFNLTNQQDAAEAFLHLLCSLREEIGGCYAPKMSSLADIFASNNRILTRIHRDWQSEHERWHQLYLGPFDGILSSSLTCQSCSSQISINLEQFDCLPLSPALSGSTLIFGCTLLDCLKQFIVAEHVENYHCHYCWHNAAIKYLSLMEQNEVELEKLRRCSDQELCDCREICNLENLPWSNRFSHTMKQLSIARCPRILCIQLKRVHMNNFGEPIKLQGHISFPLILDLSPFMTTRLGVKIPDKYGQSLPLNLRHSRRIPLPSEGKMLSFSGDCEAATEQINSNDLSDVGFVSNRQALPSDTLFPRDMQPINKVNISQSSVSQETCLYRLVSVVEHFGKAGSGHYTVYRCARAEYSGDVSDDSSNQTPMRWYCVSDSQVNAVSELDVLSSEASMLFYERIPTN
ncbi:hypothetical protein AHAS_Ahas13G0387000 [Arachis hypogaea]